MNDELPTPRPDFDFWIGEWAVHLRDTGELIGHNVIERTEGGHVLVEHYTTVSQKFSGTSLTGYDHVLGRWHQCWMDVTGLVLDLYGNVVDGSMVMSGVVEPGRLERITWTPDPDGCVRQHWQQSTDDGANWTTVFDGSYRQART
ncbi:MAG: hypothetical protein ACXV5U_02070 [Ilumatobacteraceae bacterium]